MTIARIIAAIAGIALLGAIIWAIGAGQGLMWEGAQIMSLPWGKVTLIDLYVGFIISAIVIALMEQRWWVAALWIAPIFFLGNIITAAWVILRLAPCIARLRA